MVLMTSASTEQRPGVDSDAVLALARAAADDPEQDFGNFFLSRFLQLDITYDDAEQTCTVLLPHAAHLGNPQGSVHGGIISTALDISMGHLCRRHLSAAVTVEMQLRFFRPLIGDARCLARVVNAGRRLVHLESRMTDDRGRLIAMGVGCWHRIDADSPPTTGGTP